jgi:hypothetical protein
LLQAVNPQHPLHENIINETFTAETRRPGMSAYVIEDAGLRNIIPSSPVGAGDACTGDEQHGFSAALLLYVHTRLAGDFPQLIRLRYARKLPAVLSADEFGMPAISRANSQPAS